MREPNLGGPHEPINPVPKGVNFLCESSQAGAERRDVQLSDSVVQFLLVECGLLGAGDEAPSWFFL